MLNKKIIALVLIIMLAPIQNANAKTSHHSYKNKGWKHHKLTGSKQSRYLHAISHKKK